MYCLVSVNHTTPQRWSAGHLNGKTSHRYLTTLILKPQIKYSINKHLSFIIIGLYFSIIYLTWMTIISLLYTYNTYILSYMHQNMYFLLENTILKFVCMSIIFLHSTVISFQNNLISQRNHCKYRLSNPLNK